MSIIFRNRTHIILKETKKYYSLYAISLNENFNNYIQYFDNQCNIIFLLIKVVLLIKCNINKLSMYLYKGIFFLKKVIYIFCSSFEFRNIQTHEKKNKYFILIVYQYVKNISIPINFAHPMSCFGDSHLRNNTK